MHSCCLQIGNWSFESVARRSHLQPVTAKCYRHGSRTTTGVAESTVCRTVTERRADRVLSLSLRTNDYFLFLQEVMIPYAQLLHPLPPLLLEGWAAAHSIKPLDLGSLLYAFCYDDHYCSITCGRLGERRLWCRCDCHAKFYTSLIII